MKSRSEAGGERPEAEVAGRKPGAAAGGVLAPLTRQELIDWGEEFGRSLRPPLIVALDGELGAGKTTLAQSICRGVGVREDVTSPTFALVNQHETNEATIYHLDLYRIDSPSDLTNLAWDEIVNSESIVLVEWAERAGDRLPADAIHIRLSHLPGDGDRRLMEVA